ARDLEEDRRVRKEERRKRLGLGAVFAGNASSCRRWRRERRGGRAQVAGSRGQERRFPRQKETRGIERKTEEEVTVINLAREFSAEWHGRPARGSVARYSRAGRRCHYPCYEPNSQGV